MLPKQPAFLKEFFIFGAEYLALAPAGVSTFVVNVSADADFELHKLAFSADTAGAALTRATQIVPKCSLVILDNGSGRQMMDRAIPLPSFMGDGQNPFILSAPKVFKRNASISITLANYSGAETYNVRVALIGAKIFTVSSFSNGL